MRRSVVGYSDGLVFTRTGMYLRYLLRHEGTKQIVNTDRERASL